MKFISDLHIHGRFSRATSKQLSIPNLEKYARIKGVNLLGTGDFTHPEWIKEIKSTLTDNQNGIYTTKTGFPFILQSEISLIYTQNGKGRRVHNVILAPSLEIVQQITDELLKLGRVDYDGRPIFKLSCIEFTEMLMKISKDIEVIPAHIWTPWFSLFGSKSGFDTIKEAFGDQLKNIHALETGLSSDPAMNWRLSQLDNYNLVSFSDLHSFWPWRIGREATLFNLKELTYKNLIQALRTGNNLTGTIEVDPAYGKYHWDGHRNCNVCMKPSDTIKNKGICPACGRPVTIGVEYRVEQLADRPENYKPKNAKEFHSLIPLSEILSYFLGTAVATKKVWAEYYKLVTNNRTELDILLKTPLEELQKLTNPKIAQAIITVRQGKLKVQPGYDGEYGKPIFGNKKIETKSFKPKHKQKGLGDFI